MISEEQLLKIRDGLVKRAIESGHEIATNLKRKARVLEEDILKRNTACYVIDNTTHQTISALLSMYDEQVQLRARIFQIDILLDKLKKDMPHDL